MTKKKYRFSLLLLIVLATLLRFYQLGKIPHGMTWDEAAIGYNGYAIFKTRRDEWLNFLPISFQSFGDYKAPLAIYLNGFFTALGGMNLVSVRLPFALASVAAVLAFTLWANKILNRNWSLLAGILLTFSPWHLHFSRAGFEAGLSLSFFLWALYFFEQFLHPPSFLKKNSWPNWLKNCLSSSWLWLMMASLFSVASVYSYHSAKLVVPIIMLILIIWHWKMVSRHLKSILGAGLFSSLLLTPLVWDSIKGQGLERFGTTLFKQLQGWPLVTRIGQQFLKQLSPAFLLFGQTTTLRHGGQFFGYLLPTTFFLLLLSLIYLISTYRKISYKTKRAAILAVLLIVIGSLPAAIGDEVPHANRALLALPGFLLLAVIGLRVSLVRIKNLKINGGLIGSHGERDMVLKAFFGTFILLHGLFVVTYLNSYYQKFAPQSAEAFKDGYLAAFRYVSQYETQVDKILFTSDYGQPYIYALFVKQSNPIWYQGGSLIKYEFTDQIDVGDLIRENTIVVASQEDELEPGWADKLIYGSDGEVRFKIYLPQKLRKTTNK